MKNPHTQIEAWQPKIRRHGVFALNRCAMLWNWIQEYGCGNWKYANVWKRERERDKEQAKALRVHIEHLIAFCINAQWYCNIVIIWHHPYLTGTRTICSSVRTSIFLYILRKMLECECECECTLTRWLVCSFIYMHTHFTSTHRWKILLLQYIINMYYRISGCACAEQ